MDTETLANVSAGVFTAISVLGSIRLIAGHMSTNKHAHQRALICRIIAMVPLFAVDSLIGLLDIEASETMVTVLDSVKECYEAVVIYSFLDLMYSYLNVTPTRVPDSIKGRHIHQVFPLNLFMKDLVLDPASVQHLRTWTLQFVYLRPVLSVLTVVYQVTELYDNWWAWVPISVVLNVSVTMAVYALMMIYHAFDKELASHRPLAKFLCIKGVVFFAFWQGLILQGLEYAGIVHADLWYTQAEIAEGIQNWLVCAEMGLIFTAAHAYAFWVEPDMTSAAPKSGKSGKSGTNKRD